MKLKDQVALVTGASRGIGRAIARAFAAEGARVAIVYRGSQSAAEELVQQIQQAGGTARAIQADVADPAAAQACAELIEREWGRIDILVNNAGASPAMGSVLESDERLWDTVMNLNMKGLYFTSQAVARIMKDQGGGSIINIASVDGFIPEPLVSIYSISKAGVRMITRAFALELAPYHIRVNTIAPGPISTKMLNSHWFHLPPEEAEKQKAAMAKLTPLGRIGEPDEIVGAAIYLASDASSYTTGAEIVVDGGVLQGKGLAPFNE